MAAQVPQHQSFASHLHPAFALRSNSFARRSGESQSHSRNCVKLKHVFLTEFAKLL